MKNRPVIEAKKNRFDQILEILGLVFLVLLIGIPAYYYSSLPEIVPSHFNASGEPDGYSGRWVVWLLPVIGIVIHFGLNKLSRMPHTYNYPMRLNQDNVQDAYLNGSRMMKSMVIIILGGFSYINYRMIQSAKGNYEGLGQLFLPLFICLLFGAIFFYSYRMMIAKG